MTFHVLLNTEWLLCLCCINAELLQCRSLIWGTVKACLRWVLQDINGNAKWLHWTGSLHFPFLQKIALSKEHRQIRLIPKYSMLENCHCSTRDSRRVLLSKLYLQKLSTTPAFRVHLAADRTVVVRKTKWEERIFGFAINVLSSLINPQILRRTVWKDSDARCRELLLPAARSHSCAQPGASC